jgi:endonuclease/exonuclease/phosphatase family metal-dependent hydrolase
VTEIITWNVQGGRGVDGVHSLERLAGVVSGLGDADIICFQEIAQHMPDVDGGLGIDQIAELEGLFPSHEAVFGAAVDRAANQTGPRRRFGNLVLSRLPVLQVFLHLLPQPADPAVLHMPRQATEVVVDTGTGTLRVVTTHLEFHSEVQRMAQVSRLRALHEEVCANVSRPGRDPGGGVYAPVARPHRAVFCGDYNFTPESTAYTHMLAPFEQGTVPLHDAWTVCHDNRPHDPTCGLFDHQQWPEGAHCRDYFFITADLAVRVESVKVALDTNASDHQPIRLVLRDA